MGIPSYFSYLVKNHPEVLLKWEEETRYIDNLYLDSNSIVYDAVYRLSSEKKEPLTHNEIYRAVCVKIEEYIQVISPRVRVLIALDGVAPVAKLEQQRARRYKSAYQARILATSASASAATSATVWNTAAITPGTPFMKGLTAHLRQHFQNGTKVIVSGSDEPGEGEHKICHYMRDHSLEHRDQTTVIYGLDADLIMLAMTHLHVCPQTFLFRESPHFIQNINKDLDPNAHYLLDIPALSETILKSSGKTPEEYILLCFFLGNDFLPHFPAANIRTGGIDKLLEASQGIGALCNTKGEIQWDAIRMLVQIMAMNEEFFIQEEHKLRDRRGRPPNQKNPKKEEDVAKTFELLPSYERSLEKIINPFRAGWRDRYYQVLFDSSTSTPSVCKNYLEGLQWVFTYYTTGVKDWRWKYHYSYPPLFGDLLKYMEQTMPHCAPGVKSPDEGGGSGPISETTQLLYVLPKASMVEFLPRELTDRMLAEHPEWWSTTATTSDTKSEFLWAYCKYFWESHVLLPNMDDLLLMDQPTL